MNKSKRDWNVIQQFYDAGHSINETAKKFDLWPCRINHLVKLGRFKTRSGAEGCRIAAKKRIFTPELRLKYSLRAKKAKTGGYRARAGRGKRAYRKDSFGKCTLLQSSYEVLCADILKALKVKWYRPKALKYLQAGIDKKYFPDFYLPKLKIYLEPKNDYLIIKDAEKIRLAGEQNNVKIIILTKQQITKEFLGLLTHSAEYPVDNGEAVGAKPARTTNLNLDINNQGNYYIHKWRDLLLEGMM